MESTLSVSEVSTAALAHDSGNLRDNCERDRIRTFAAKIQSNWCIDALEVLRCSV